MSANVHGIDTFEANLIECPHDDLCPWTWGEESPSDGGPPPYCPACGDRVKIWFVKDEWETTGAVKSAADNSAKVRQSEGGVE